MAIVDPRLNVLIYGAFAHTCEAVSLGHLLDRIKVCRELNPALRSNLAATHYICNKEGVSGFLKGSRWNISLSALKGGIGWTLNRIAYDVVSWTTPHYEKERPVVFSIAVGSTTGSLEAALFICPLNRLKTVEMSSKGKLNVGDKLQKHGLGYFYKGFSTTAIRYSVGWIACLTIYNHLKEKVTHPMALGGLTGGCAAVVSSPMDTVISRLQQEHGSRGALNDARHIYLNYGLRGFYQGFTPKVLRAGWNSAIVIYVLNLFNALPPNMQVAR